MTALVGTNAHFHCAGTGDLLMWIVDGSLHYYQNIVVRGISAFVVPFPNSLESTLTVPATLENNGTTVRCILQSAFSASFSTYCTLTVLPGKLGTTQLCTYMYYSNTYCMCNCILCRYWSCSQPEIQPIIQSSIVGSSINCWCTQWSLLSCDCDKQWQQ